MEKDEKQKEPKVEELKKEEVKKETIKKEEPKKEEKKQEIKTETKKVEEKKKEPAKNVKKEVSKEKNKNLWGIIVAIILIVALAIGIGCAFIFQNTPNSAIEGMLHALKTGDTKKVEEYTNYQDIMNKSDLSEEGNMNEETQKLLFNKLDWKIEEVKKDADKATAKVQFTNKDYKIVIGNYMQKALKVAFSGNAMTEQEMENYLIDELKNEQVQTTTVTKVIQLEKQEGKWRVVVDSELMSGLMPGLEDVVNSLNNINVSE